MSGYIYVAIELHTGNLQWTYSPLRMRWAHDETRPPVQDAEVVVLSDVRSARSKLQQT